MTNPLCQPHNLESYQLSPKRNLDALEVTGHDAEGEMGRNSEPQHHPELGLRRNWHKDTKRDLGKSREVQYPRNQETEKRRPERRWGQHHYIWQSSRSTRMRTIPDLGNTKARMAPRQTPLERLHHIRK